MLWRGVALALAAALTHTAIDSTRKHASNTVPPEALVYVVAILEAIISVSAVASMGGLRNLIFLHPGAFASATAGSSILLLASKYVYQRALQMSPLSLTIPYLSLTPAFLIFTAYILLGEVPSVSGLAGVAVVALGGWLLNRRAGPGTPAKQDSADASRCVQGVEGASSSALVQAAPNGAAAPSLLNGAAYARTASNAVIVDIESCASGSAPQMPAPLMADAAGSKWRPGSKLRRMTPAGTQGGGGSGASAPIDGSFLPALLALMPGTQEPGTMLMLLVAAAWAVTASLDKMGVIYGPSAWAYLAAQRLSIGVMSACYVLFKAPGLLRYLLTSFPLLLSLALLETGAVVLFLMAVRYLLVSYVVAIKRCNVLFSVLMAALLFRESVGRRLPYVMIMLAGVTLIVVEPQSISIHFPSHHARHALVAATPGLLRVPGA